jgi:hypothetical protein
MVERRLRILVLVYLWVALIEDTLLFAISWIAPDLWFRLFNHALPVGFDVAFLRRSAGQWIAFALVQAITLWRWKKQPVWLPIEAGVRFSDLFTDLSYIMVTWHSLTTLGWFMLLPPPLLNLVGVVIMLRAYKQTQGCKDASA